MCDREAAENHIAEEMPAELPHRGHHPSHAEGGANLFRLARTGRTRPDHFLERDDVRVDVAEHFGNPLRRGAAIHAATAVDVVGRDPEIDMRGCLRLAHC
jgi:hypothetical protein